MLSRSPLRTVADLVMILCTHDQLLGPHVQWRTSVPAFAVHGILTLVDVSVPKRYRQIFDSIEINIVAGGLASHHAMQCVVKVIGPVRIESVAAHAPRRAPAGDR